MSRVGQLVDRASSSGKWAVRLALRTEPAQKVRRALWPAIRQVYKVEKMKYTYAGKRILSEQEGNDYLAQSVLKPPAAIARLGGTERKCLVHYMKNKDANGYCSKSWGVEGVELYVNSGVYPNTIELLNEWSKIYEDSMRQIDVLGCWYRPGENLIQRTYAPNATLMEIMAFESYYNQRPWTHSLAGKRVVVMSPFAKSIESQYARRHEVWAAMPEVMPEFHLRTIRVPLSAGLTGGKTEYPTWVDGLEGMKRQMNEMMKEEPFDVCIVGAGAWALPLIVHAKNIGAWGLHLGGATQLLFGLKGGRWDSNPDMLRLYNDAWVRPAADEVPQHFKKMENGAYW